MLGYALESMRYRADCDGSLFWMFNDCWGEVGWTIIDYYLRRKPSWYFVRRAFSPVRRAFSPIKMILRSVGDDIRGVVANDTAEDVFQSVEYGYISLDGSYSDLKETQVAVPSMGQTEFALMPRGDHDPTLGLWFARPQNAPLIPPAIFRAVDYRELQVLPPGLESNLIKSNGLMHILRVRTQSYAHAVRLILPDGSIPSDNYFDLLPGESRDIQIVSPETLNTETIHISCVNNQNPH